MRGNYFLRDRKFRLGEIPVPETGRHDVLIRVAAYGICGTDVHIYHGSRGSVEMHPPVILRHELAGVVEETGSAATTVEPGDRVTVGPSDYCGKCHYCKIGKKQVCESLYAMGINRDDDFAQYCAVPETQCYQLDREIPLKYDATTESLVCYTHGIDRIGLVLGNTVCVIGDGVIGLIVVRLAKLSGASRVALNEPVSMRREAGMKVGMNTIIGPVHEEVGQWLTKIPETPGADVVIECVGIPVAIEQASGVASKGVVILFFSIPNPGSIYVMHPGEISQKELTIVGSIINPNTYGRTVVLINGNTVQLKPLIIHLFSPDQLEQTILAQQSSESIKVIVEP